MNTKMMLFGATGDLAKAKIMPALNAIGVTPLLYGRKDIDVPNYIKGELNEISEKIKDLDITHAYVSLPPSYFELVLQELSKLKVVPRIALEKPFGTSLENAVYLTELVKQLGLEEKVYLVDHYLGKPALLHAQKLNIDSIASIKIDAYEKNDVATRGAFYDGVGTIRDFVQNHIMVIIGTLLAQDVEGSDRSAARLDVLQSLSFIPESFIQAQYEGFKQIPGVRPDSDTETYVEVEFDYADRFPIDVRVGKALSESVGVAHIFYKNAPVQEIQIQSSINTYEVILADFLANTSRFSLSFAEVERNWQITEEIRAAKEDHSMLVYPQGGDIENIF
jgi:glucose-6-phosphate 1-dehydrogenase